MIIRKRIEFGEVSPEPSWSNRPVFIIGGGPSIIGHDISRLRERGWVLGVNRAADEVPCDATMTVDMVFAGRRSHALREWSKTQEVYIAVPTDYPRPPVEGATYLKRLPLEGCSRNPGAIHNGLNSGYGAVQVAIHKGGKEIYLLGFDMTDPGDGPVHWHSGYGNPASRNAVRTWGDWARRFDQLAAEVPEGVVIKNANPKSRVTAFPFTSYEELGL